LSAIDNRNYIKTFHDFDIFKGCFGTTRIMPTDLDFIVERKNKFLCMEFKPDDKILFSGQNILLQRLSNVPNFTFVLVYHTKGRTLHESLNVTSMKIYPNGDRVDINNDDLKSFVKEWFFKVDKKQ